VAVAIVGALERLVASGASMGGSGSRHCSIGGLAVLSIALRHEGQII
jgi:hypothetical protein